MIIVIVFGAFLILRSIKNFIINAVVGLVILFLANHVAGLDIGYSWLVILICGIGGILGAFLVILATFPGPWSLGQPLREAREISSWSDSLKIEAQIVFRETDQRTRRACCGTLTLARTFSR